MIYDRILYFVYDVITCAKHPCYASPTFVVVYSRLVCITDSLKNALLTLTYKHTHASRRVYACRFNDYFQVNLGHLKENSVDPDSPGKWLRCPSPLIPRLLLPVPGVCHEAVRLPGTGQTLHILHDRVPPSLLFRVLSVWIIIQRFTLWRPSLRSTGPRSEPS